MTKILICHSGQGISAMAVQALIATGLDVVEADETILQDFYRAESPLACCWVEPPQRKQTYAKAAQSDPRLARKQVPLPRQLYRRPVFRGK